MNFPKVCNQIASSGENYKFLQGNLKLLTDRQTVMADFNVENSFWSGSGVRLKLPIFNLAAGFDRLDTEI